MIRLLPIVATFALLVSGCSRDWHAVRYEPSVRTQTKVTVFSEPPGAEILVNGSFRGVTPLTIPFVYRYRNVVWARKKSYVAYRDVEERVIPEWINNEFLINLSKPGFEAEPHPLALKGQKALEVHIAMTPAR